jgi:preprotein translocase subunit SecE
MMPIWVSVSLVVVAVLVVMGVVLYLIDRLNHG